MEALESGLGLTRAKATPALKSLEEREVVTRSGEVVRLVASEEEAHKQLAIMRGLDKLTPVVERLVAADAPLWKSDLYGEVETDLNALRRLQTAGLVALSGVMVGSIALM